MKKLALLFGMSENERKGFLALSMFIVLIGSVPLVYNIYAQRTTDDVLPFVLEVAEVQRALPSKITTHETITRKTKRELFSFDPNNLPVEKWKALGFSKKQVEVIKNYEAKGGRFRTKADVAKLYVVSDEDFSRLAPYITLPETVSATPKEASEPHKTIHKTTKNKTEATAPLPLVDLAIADTLALKEIRGIGSVLASRIVKFRDALGGFHTVEQVKEVFGITEDQFMSMESQLLLGDDTLLKLPINKLSIEALARHPYISRKEATHIVRYREQHGVFESLTDLEKMYALNDDFLRKIAPYLKFDP